MTHLIQYVNIRDFMMNEENHHRELETTFGLDKWMYVGRYNSKAGMEKSALANPIKRKKGQPAGSTLPDYRKWLWKQLCEGNAGVVEAIERIAKGEIKAIVCWCEDRNKCHSSIIMKAAQWYNEEVLNKGLDHTAAC